ncbi:MAG: hypothetical protein VXW84_12335, partial [Verrucomicrobiota bacterium]|nr:hypothetical protein [Verrucomicrobiota bacterium]
RRTTGRAPRRRDLNPSFDIQAEVLRPQKHGHIFRHGFAYTTAPFETTIWAIATFFGQLPHLVNKKGMKIMGWEVG